jgi:hypothetical protein
MAGGCNGEKQENSNVESSCRRNWPCICIEETISHFSSFFTFYFNICR